MIRAWDMQFCWSPWLSLGFHLDHTDPSLTLHLPGVILAVGRLKQPGFRRSGGSWGDREASCPVSIERGGPGDGVAPFQ